MISGRQRGFTLLELLIAVALTSMVVIGIMGVFRNMVTMYADVRQSRESTIQLRALVGILGDDLLTLAREFPFTGSTGESDGNFLRLLEFVGGVSLERQEPQPEIKRVMVTYSLTRIGEDEQWTLMRGERPHPSIFDNKDWEWEDSPIAVLQHVDDLKFFYEWQANKEQDFCSIQAGGIYPLFVRLEVALRHGDKLSVHSLRFPVGRRL